MCDVVSLVYSTININSVHVSNPAVISHSNPQMALVAVSSKVNFFHDDGLKCHLINHLPFVVRTNRNVEQRCLVISASPCLKGQSHEIFDPFFISSKTSLGGPNKGS